jgi:hypothetical protein
LDRLNGLPVSEIYPKRIPTCSVKPVILSGRFHGPRKARWLRVRSLAGRIQGTLLSCCRHHRKNTMCSQRCGREQNRRPDEPGLNDAAGKPEREIASKSPRSADFRLMTQFTSFVAVEEKRVVEGGKPRLVQVPVEMPSGVSYEGVFGEREERVAKNMMYRGSMAAPAVMPAPAGNLGSFRISERRAQAQAVPAEEPKRDADESQAKLAPELVTLVNGGSLPSYAAYAVTNGKVKVKVWLLDSSAAAMAALKKAGLEFSGQRQIRCCQESSRCPS